MFGLLDNLDDPKKLMLLQMGLGLLGGAPQGRKNFGADLAHAGQQGLLGYQAGSQMQMRKAEEEQQRAMRQMQIDEQKRLMGVREKMAQAAQRNVIPGMPQMQPTDYETPSGPAGPSSFNMEGYAKDLFGAGPEGIQQGIQLLSSLRQQNAPIKVGKDDRLVMPGSFKEVLSAAPGERWEDIGRDPKTGQHMQRNSLTGQLKAVGSMPQQVNVSTNMPPQEKAILKADEERLGELSTAASASRRIAQTSSVINNLLRGKEGGQMVKIGAETARFLGFQNDTVAANDLVESLNTQLATQIRAPGSGATSNLEFEAYKAAAPSLKNSEQGRALMANVAQKFADRNAKLADHARALIRQGKYSDTALAEYDDKLGSVLGEDLLKKLRAAQPSFGGTNVLRFDSQGNPI